MTTKIESMGFSLPRDDNGGTSNVKKKEIQSIEVVKKHTNYNKGVKVESEEAAQKAERAKHILNTYGIKNIDNERITDLQQDGTVLVCTYEDGSKLTFDRQTGEAPYLGFYNGKYNLNGKNFVFEPGRNVTDIHVQPNTEQGELYFHDITSDINVTMNEKTDCAIRNSMKSGDGNKHTITVKRTYGPLNILTACTEEFYATK